MGSGPILSLERTHPTFQVHYFRILAQQTIPSIYTEGIFFLTLNISPH